MKGTGEMVKTAFQMYTLRIQDGINVSIIRSKHFIHEDDEWSASLTRDDDV